MDLVETLDLGQFAEWLEDQLISKEDEPVELDCHLAIWLVDAIRQELEDAALAA